MQTQRMWEYQKLHLLVCLREFGRMCLCGTRARLNPDVWNIWAASLKIWILYICTISEIYRYFLQSQPHTQPTHPQRNAMMLRRNEAHATHNLRLILI